MAIVTKLRTAIQMFLIQLIELESNQLKKSIGPSQFLFRKSNGKQQLLKYQYNGTNEKHSQTNLGKHTDKYR